MTAAPRLRAGRTDSRFTGSQHATDAAAIDAWVGQAHSGERMIYCSAPDLIRGEGSARVRELEREGLVTPHQHRRAGGGFDYLIIRTGRAMVRPRGAAPDPIDAASLAILAAFKRAANLFMACPSDADLARIAGLETRDQAKWRVRKLVRAGLISTQQVTEDGVTTRVVTILDKGGAGRNGAGKEGSGKSSKPPPKMLAAQRALRASMLEGDGR